MLSRFFCFSAKSHIATLSLSLSLSFVWSLLFFSYFCYVLFTFSPNERRLTTTRRLDLDNEFNGVEYKKGSVEFRQAALHRSCILRAVLRHGQRQAEINKKGERERDLCYIRVCAARETISLPRGSQASAITEHTFYARCSHGLERGVCLSLIHI